VFKGFLLEHSNPVVFVLWIQILLPLMVWALIGWIVARVDIRNYRRDLVVIFACWMAVVHLVLIGPAISYMVGLGASHLVIPIAAYAATSIAAILLGGSLHRPQSERCADAV
jgi:predicted membrane-bound mannosyltransferase